MACPPDAPLGVFDEIRRMAFAALWERLPHLQGVWWIPGLGSEHGIPEDVLARFSAGGLLPLDFMSRWPMNLEITATSLKANLSFGQPGQPTVRVCLPWSALVQVTAPEGGICIESRLDGGACAPPASPAPVVKHEGNIARVDFRAARKGPRGVA